jgi:hypothetical protein
MHFTKPSENCNPSNMNDEDENMNERNKKIFNLVSTFLLITFFTYVFLKFLYF